MAKLMKFAERTAATNPNVLIFIHENRHTLRQNCLLDPPLSLLFTPRQSLDTGVKLFFKMLTWSATHRTEVILLVSLQLVIHC